MKEKNTLVCHWDYSASTTMTHQKAKIPLSILCIEIFKKCEKREKQSEREKRETIRERKGRNNQRERQRERERERKRKIREK
jgi:hypothetical protein